MRDLLARAAEALDDSHHTVAAKLSVAVAAAEAPEGLSAFPSVPALRHLTVAAMTNDAHGLTHRVIELADRIPWREVDPAIIPDSYIGRHAFCELLGPDGLVASHSCRIGLYVQAPETLYGAHSHAAEEIFLVLSGTAHWQRGDGPFEAHTSGTLIHHRADQSHATRTLAEPLLAIWGWQGDIAFDSYRLHDHETG